MDAPGVPCQGNDTSKVLINLLKIDKVGKKSHMRMWRNTASIMGLLSLPGSYAIVGCDALNPWVTSS